MKSKITLALAIIALVGAFLPMSTGSANAAVRCWHAKRCVPSLYEDRCYDTGTHGLNRNAWYRKNGFRTGCVRGPRGAVNNWADGCRRMFSRYYKVRRRPKRCVR